MDDDWGELVVKYTAMQAGRKGGWDEVKGKMHGLERWAKLGEKG